jgi:hypothetical protein
MPSVPGGQSSNHRRRIDPGFVPSGTTATDLPDSCGDRKLERRQRSTAIAQMQLLGRVRGRKQSSSRAKSHMLVRDGMIDRAAVLDLGSRWTAATVLVVPRTTSCVFAIDAQSRMCAAVSHHFYVATRSVRLTARSRRRIARQVTLPDIC